MSIVFIDYNRLESLTSRMEGVAESMAGSAEAMSEFIERFETAVEKMTDEKEPEQRTIDVSLHLDGKEIANAIRRNDDDGKARR